VIVDAEFLNEWAVKNHKYGECMSHNDSTLMYVHIPKNASSWTKPNLKDFGWQFYNYHSDNLYNKHALVVLRDPVERWVSGIAEYLTLYHSKLDPAHLGRAFFDIIFDRVTFDDHTERQVKFLHGLDTSNCTFIWCDELYRTNFSDFIKTYYGENKYNQYEYQHVSELSPQRKQFKDIFIRALEQNSKYLTQIKNHFEEDYKLIKQVKFYGTR